MHIGNYCSLEVFFYIVVIFFSSFLVGRIVTMIATGLPPKVTLATAHLTCCTTVVINENETFGYGMRKII